MMTIFSFQFNCCGVDGYEDYKESNHSVPLTCCGLNIFKCASKEYITAQGCRDAFAGYWATNTEIMIFSGLGQLVDEAWKHYDKSTKAMDAIQKAFNCCGVYGYKDYNVTRVPPSCCNLEILTCSAERYEKLPGCREEFLNYWDTNLQIILYSSLGIAAVQLTCIVIGILKYVVLMNLVFLVHLLLITLLCVKQDALVDLAAQLVDEIWERNDESRNTMDALQLAFKCCGVYDYEDYIRRLQKIPSTCCNLDIETCATEGYKNVPGCLDVFLDYWDTNLHVILYSSLGIAVVQMACVIIGLRTVYKLRSVIND
uniref:Tetraspanin n=1 Tax=Glossina austeni TaxID=7395 RepID=A0A1A9VHV2_GLOAU